MYVTHDQVEAMTIGDRIAVMREGVLQQVGTPKELYEAPTNHFVAGFIGSPAMNFLTGHVVTDGDTTALALDGLSIPLSGRAAAMARSRSNGSSLTVGMRPEHFDAATPGMTGTVRVPAVVDVVKFLGKGELIHANVVGNDVVALVPASRGVTVGDTVELAIADKLMHAFDPETHGALSLDDTASMTSP